MQNGYDNPYRFVVRHAMFSTLAIMLLLGTSMLSETWVRRAGAFLLLASVLAMMAIFVIGHESKARSDGLIWGL